MKVRKMGTSLMVTGVFMGCFFGAHLVTEMVTAQPAVASVPVKGWIYAPHTDYRQPTRTSCVPTSSAMALSSLGVHRTPEQLMAAMHTSWRGTKWAGMAGQMNADLPAGWMFGQLRIKTPADLTKALALSVDHGAALPETVETTRVAYFGNPGPHAKDNYHEIVIDGLNTRTGRVRTYDPAVLPAVHVMTVRELFQGLEIYHGYHWTNFEEKK